MAEFAGKPRAQITTGSVQASFHEKERKATRGQYTGAYPIVVVGASAGGIESFSELLTHLPADTGMSFIFIQHLSPQHESILPAILSRVTKMTVVHGSNDQVAEPNHVYVIPPNTNMGIVHGVLKTMPRIESPGRHMPIDFIFRCLADDQAHFGIGIVLSGADGDGAQGLRAIRAQGGITFVQDPKTAKVDGMPKSAILAGGTDTVLSIPDIAQELVRLSKHPYSFRKMAVEQEDINALKAILQMLRTYTGVNFEKYKRGTVTRRLRRRVVLHKANSLSDYLQVLQRNNDELDELYRDLLINVTNFFRDSHVFDLLIKKAFPKLLQRKTRDSVLRIWVAGCSSGEEVYSLVMALHEAMDQVGIHLPVQIFASDLSEGALQKAREAVYPNSITVDVSPERLRRFFTKLPNGDFKVTNSIRESCVFAMHDVTRDPPFSRMDFVSCRNLLIYLDPQFQQRVINLFAYALNPRGYLLLGNSETVGNSDAFNVASKSARIYVRKPILSRSHFDVPLSPSATRIIPVKSTFRSSDGVLNLERTADAILLERFSPPGVVVNGNAEVIEFRGRTGGFLEPSPGEATLSLFKLARPGLDTELRVLLKKAEKQQEPVRKENLSVRLDGKVKNFALEVIPIRVPDDHFYFLILFDEKGPARETALTISKKRTADISEKEDVRLLQEELSTTREYLQSIIHDQETSNEELQAANEEVLSSNEELQSTNEELETAKEELQSTNEELTTVNDELSNRNNQLVQVNNDLSNLLASVNIPIIMVGNDLRIRRFTPMVERVFNVIASDIGRPITDIKPNIDVPDLKELILDAIETVRTTEREVQDRSGHWYSLRIRPYRTEDNKMDGAVLVLVDIGSIRQNTKQLQETHATSELILDSLSQPVLFLDAQFRVRKTNQAFCRTFQVQGAEIKDKSFFDLCDGAWDTPLLKALFDGVVPNHQQITDYQVEAEFPHVGNKSMTVSARRVQRDGAVNILVILDLT